MAEAAGRALQVAQAFRGGFRQLAVNEKYCKSWASLIPQLKVLERGAPLMVVGPLAMFTI